MQNALDDAWDRAADYDEFKTNIFRFKVPSDEDSYYKVYLSTFKQYRYYRPTKQIVKCCKIMWWDDENFPGDPKSAKSVDSAAESKLDIIYEEDSNSNEDDLLKDIVDNC